MDTHNNGKRLADMVKLGRARAELSVQRAAELAGMNRSTWADLEDAEARPPRPETLARVAKVLEIDVEELLVAAGIIDPPRPSVDLTSLVEVLQAMRETIERLEQRVASLEQPSDD